VVQVYRAYLALGDQVRIEFLKHRNGMREEFQTALSHTHEFSYGIFCEATEKDDGCVHQSLCKSWREEWDAPSE
jgi:hypothetical protein